MRKTGGGAAARWFAALLSAAALLLLAQIGWQTKWIEGLRPAAQPRMLPLVALSGVLLFAAASAFAARGKADGAAKREAAAWLRPAEYLLYFMLYVGATSALGYGPSTVLFCALLAWRAGCPRRQRAFAAAFGLGVALFFKGVLSVKIPGAGWYDWEFLPAAVRLFLTLNF